MDFINVWVEQILKVTQDFAFVFWTFMNIFLSSSSSYKIVYVT